MTTHPVDVDDAKRNGELADEAENAIREILLELEDKTGKRIDQVTVDTRNFAECRTEIHFR